MDKNYSLADIGALMNNRNGDGYGWGGNGMWVIFILFFFVFGFAGNGWGAGGNAAMQGALTRAELYDGLNDNTIIRKLDGINNGLCDGFYAANTTMLNGFNTIGSQIAENRFEGQRCCCETNRNIDAVRYENAQNTCAITTNATANTQKILDKLCVMESNAKDQRIADLTANLQTANFQLSQQAQNATLISTLRPTPIPAYITCSPFVSAYYGSYGYNNGYNGNGCGGCGCSGF